MCLHFSHKGIDFSYEKEWGESFTESGRHYPNVIFLIIIHLVISFYYAVIEYVIIVIRISSIYFNASHEAGLVLSVFHGEAHLLFLN